MEPDPGDMDIRRNLALLRFAAREGDARLTDLLVAALVRDAAVPPRGVGAPSPLARRTLGHVFARLGLEDG